MPDVSGQDLSSDVLACIELCIDCHKACTQTLTHCLQTGGEHVEPNHVRLMLDCAQICQTSADFMMRGSDLHAHTCRACAIVCRRCAESCAQLDDDPRMRACAEQCARCAESCERMSTMDRHAAGAVVGAVGAKGTSTRRGRAAVSATVRSDGRNRADELPPKRSPATTRGVREGRAGELPGRRRV